MRRIALMFILNFYRLPYYFFKLMWLTSKKNAFSKEKKYAFLHKAIPCAIRAGRVDIRSFGLENIPKENGFLMFSNHQGMFDAMSLIYLLDRPFSTLSKKETENVPLLSRVLSCMNVEYIDRDDVRASLKTIQHVAQRVKDGDNFVIYPEGHRSRNSNKLAPFKPGAFKSATLSKCPIVPVALVDSYKPFDIPSIKRTTVYIRFLKPIEWEEYKNMKTTELSMFVSNRISEAIHNMEKKAAREESVGRLARLLNKIRNK
ncbi:MAG: 1-acyl-sn-glycerol-3-phosphate acyltransferase [Lachnospiraceae bacterium]|nr:1-acyl-sn-glycerol-3-phosphate acyltransferase [Lachnospiraceae bacterium]